MLYYTNDETIKTVKEIYVKSVDLKNNNSARAEIYEM